MTQPDTQVSPEAEIHRVKTLIQPPSAEAGLKARYSIDLPLSYHTLGRTLRSGEGRVVNIGSHDVTVACLHELTAGSLVELTIEWPARLHGRIPIRLIMIGRVVRCEVSGFAVASCQHRFMLAGGTSPADGVAGSDSGDPREPIAAGDPRESIAAGESSPDDRPAPPDRKWSLSSVPFVMTRAQQIQVRERHRAKMSGLRSIGSPRAQDLP